MIVNCTQKVEQAKRVSDVVGKLNQEEVKRSQHSETLCTLTDGVPQGWLRRVSGAEIETKGAARSNISRNSG